MTFYHPWFLLLIPVIFLIGVFVKTKKKDYGIRFSSLSSLQGTGKSTRTVLYSSLIYLRCIALSLIVLAIARLQTPLEDSLRRSDAVDIVLAVDLSESMLAEDFMLGGKRQNRIDALKGVLPDFIAARKNDRIGMIVFATRAFVASPLTFNHNWLLERVDSLNIGVIDGRRTAIGSGIATSLNRLKDSQAKSKVIILLTDGRNNAGEITPETASHIAQALGVKIYTVGVGSTGLAPFPIRDLSGNIVGYDSIKADIDEPLLMRIARETGAKYFRVYDNASLKNVYKEIDSMEKIYIEEREYGEYNELFVRFLLPALMILLFEIIASNTFLRKIP